MSSESENKQKNYTTKEIINIHIENPECENCKGLLVKMLKYMDLADMRREVDGKTATFICDFSCHDCLEEITMRFQTIIDPIEITQHGEHNF